jgi:hypothetical protein
MISYKKMSADGNLTRFLSDFIIKNEQYVRVYAYIYDSEGEDGTLSGDYYIRTSDYPDTDDLQGLDLWDLVDNSISFYDAPSSGVTIWIEVSTTPEEFDVAEQAAEDAAAAQAAAEDAQAAAEASEAACAADEAIVSGKVDEISPYYTDIETCADNIDAIVAAEGYATDAQTAAGQAASARDAAQLAETNAETAEALAEQWANEDEDVVVDSGKYSAKHYALKAEAIVDINLDSCGDVDTTGKVDGDFLQYDSGTGNWGPGLVKPDTPSITISTTVDENSTTAGTIDDYDSTYTYTITAGTGTIQNQSGANFEYVAPDVTDDDDDTDTISISCTFGFFESDTDVTNMTITFVDIEEDDSVDYSGATFIEDNFETIENGGIA